MRQRWSRRQWGAFIGMGLVCCAAQSLPPSTPSPLLGRGLPELPSRSFEGVPLQIKSWRGRVVVVKFFAQFCEPCQWTLPALQRLYRENPEVAVLGISLDERVGDTYEVIRTHGITFPVIRDQARVMSGRFRIRELPATFVADTAGTVRWVGGAGQREPELAQAVQVLLSR